MRITLLAVVPYARKVGLIVDDHHLLLAEGRMVNQKRLTQVLQIFGMLLRHKDEFSVLQPIVQSTDGHSGIEDAYAVICYRRR